MADTEATRDSGESVPAANGNVNGANGKEKVRAAEPNLVLPSAAEATDDTPTVISRALPGHKHAITLADGLSLRGRSLAHFELLEPIGVGGMAAVIRARDKQLDRFVALKILPPEMAADPENVRRFHQEARAAAKLDHENIARVFFCGEDQNLHFIAFEFVEGENLRAILERRGRLPVPEAVRYMLQIATGLEHAASRGVVHRDIKPSNIIITPTGRAKLVDMGLARSLEPQSDMALTQSGVTLGTFDYISPEQALEPREADARSDIYSLGCTFYHMVTGQAPVPEGTAAKKLHHHQHISPLDPRQLNPEIPDEVAAVLSRMMAKDPKDRYQRPVHLVQHLMQVAQRVGAAAEVPEGVMFVDAPLPNMPRKRPVLMMALAVCFLGALLFVLSLTPPGQGLPPPDFRGDSSDKNRGNGGPPKSVRPPAIPVVENNKVFHLPADLDMLRTVLAAEEEKTIHVSVDSPTEISEPLIFKGKGTLKVEGTTALDGKDGAVIRMKYDPEADETCHAAILIDGGNALFKNIRFESQTSFFPKIPVASVMVRASGMARFEKCWFTQILSPGERLIPKGADYFPLASVAIEDHSGKAPSIQLDRCYFEAGQDAIAVNGKASISSVNCAFGPHGSLFHFRSMKKQESELLMQRCSAFVVNGPAFRFDKEARCAMRVATSIFSCPDEPLSPLGDVRALLFQSDDADTPHVRYEGDHNLYHNLNSFWVWKTRIDAATWEEFKSKLAQTGGKESAKSVVLRDASVTPWAYPYDARTNEPKNNFQVNFIRPDVRLTRDVALGVQECVWGPQARLQNTEINIAAEPALKANEKIVDPDAQDPKPGVFKLLAGAMGEAVKDDVIFIKQPRDGRAIELPPRLETKAEILTLRAYKGHRPVLTLALAAGEQDAALFKIYDGELRLENLDIVLRSALGGYKSQSVVAISGDGKCDFKQCAITMKDIVDGAPLGVPLRVALIESPDNAMKMMKRQSPGLSFSKCIIRGEGELVRMSKSRPAELTVDNCLLALSGSLACLYANAKESPADPGIKIQLTQVSAFLNDPMLKFKGDEVKKNLITTRVNARDCLFASLPPAGKPLIFLDGLRLDEELLGTYVPWSNGNNNGNHNAYNGFNKLIEQQAPEMMIAPIIRQDNWKTYSRETDARFLQVKFKLPPSPILSRAILDDFQPAVVEMDLQGYGARYADLPTLPAATRETPAENP